MKKLLELGSMLLLVMFLLGCQNMMHKSVAVNTSVKAVKVILGDASSYFMPMVIFGFGSGCLVDMPMQEGAEVFFYSEDSAIFSGSLSGKTMVYMKAGTGAIKGHIKLEIEDGKIVDIPIFKLYSPFKDVKDVLIDGVPVVPAE